MTPDRTPLPKLARQPEIPDSFSLPAARRQLPAASRRFFLVTEFLALFIGLPVALFFGLATRLPPLPILWAAALYCLVLLLRDPTFDRRQLWNAAHSAHNSRRSSASFSSRPLSSRC